MAFQPTWATPSVTIGSSGVTSGITATYTNGVQITASQWDFTCLFFHSVPVPTTPGEEMTTERRLAQAVVMSPQHAKALATILRMNVERWEATNGEIQLPDDLYEELEGGTPGTSPALSPDDPSEEGL
jgi:hypothetical protein